MLLRPKLRLDGVRYELRSLRDHSGPRAFCVSAYIPLSWDLGDEPICDIGSKLPQASRKTSDFDAVKEGFAIGWCAENNREEPVQVELLADGVSVTSAVADIFRQDLLVAGIGKGRHGFRLDVSKLAAKPDVILQIRTVGGGYMIFNSGRSLKDMSAP